MPANHGRGTHNHEGIAPSTPAAAEEHPKGAIGRPQPRAPVASQGDHQLLTERSVFKKQRPPGARRGHETLEQHEKEAKHHASVDRSPCQYQALGRDRVLAKDKPHPRPDSLS